MFFLSIGNLSPEHESNDMLCLATTYSFKNNSPSLEVPTDPNIPIVHNPNHSVLSSYQPSCPHLFVIPKRSYQKRSQPGLHIKSGKVKQIPLACLIQCGTKATYNYIRT